MAYRSQWLRRTQEPGLKRIPRLGPNFITVIEFRRSGHAHLHVLINRYPAQGWVSEGWQAVGGGRIVDIRAIDLHRVGAYLSKYLTKDMIQGQMTTRYRRYTTSRNIILLVKQSSGQWALIQTPIEALYAFYRGSILGEDWDPEARLLGFWVDDA